MTTAIVIVIVVVIISFISDNLAHNNVDSGTETQKTQKTNT